MATRSSTLCKLPKLTKENLYRIMSEQIAVTKNEQTSIPMLWQGMLELEVDTGGAKRAAKLYIPADTPQGTTFVLLNVPEGWESTAFLLESGWLACAEKYQLPLFVAEPGPSGWSTREAEQVYIDACARALFAGIYIRAGMSAYVVGYGSIGICLHRYTLNNPLRVAAAVFADASTVEDRDLDLVRVSSLDEGNMTFDLLKQDVPVPVWLICEKADTQTKNTATYWRQAAGTGKAVKDELMGTVWNQKRKRVCTPAGPIVQVCVKECSESRIAPAFTEKLCAFLRQYARYNKIGPYGNSLVPYVDYAAAGVEVRYFPDSKGGQRECLLYIPKAFRDGRKLPLVFAIHGSSESVRNYFEESLLYQKADKEGFMVVMPETALYPMPHELSGGIPMAYRPMWAFCSTTFTEEAAHAEDDLCYFNHILSAVIAEYPVDERRIYATGHSNGFMMATLWASSPYGHRLAALAVTSGVTSVWDKRGEEKIPVYMTMGEYDLWSYRLEEETGLTRGIDLWLVRNGLTEEDRAKEKRTHGADETFISGRHHCAIWKNAAGIPMVRYDWIAMKDHMNTADENNLFWDEWFSKWTMEKDKGRCYEGHCFEEGENHAKSDVGRLWETSAGG